MTLVKTIEEEELDLLNAGENHLRPLIISKFEKTKMRRVYYPIIGYSNYLLLSLRQMPDAFRRVLFTVYELDYGLDIKRFGLSTI